MTNRFFLGIAAAVLALALGACSSVKLDEAGAPIESRSGQGMPGTAGDGTAAGAAGTGAAGAGAAGERAVGTVTIGDGERPDPFSDPDNPLSRRSIYFDFDEFTIREEFAPVIEAHARYLVANRNQRVIIQGNADERGSREYNLALGQKRAEAVRRALAVLGANESQLEAVSFGEEKPRALGSNEEAWAENRRADIVYQ
ncbi:MAG: peptidoglycan-associated lipoprotein Pal [Burkholderiales bacterium]|nr:MAG: peptidoglycan-associated lipoprotein Pal [Burkholderiales bacterium]